MAKYQNLKYYLIIFNLIITFFIVQPSTDSLIKQYLSLNLSKTLTLLSSILSSSLLPLTLLSAVAAAAYLSTRRRRPSYLVDFACYRPSDSFRAPFNKFMHHTHNIPSFLPSSIEFQHKILQGSGLSDDTVLPASHHAIPFRPTMAASHAESELVIFSMLDSLFEKTRLRPRAIDILVVNYSLFSPTSSLAAMIVNKYKMRSDIRSFNLGGMGCSAGLISIELAAAQLHAHKNSMALVITTEIVTEHWYTGTTG